jgi:hypothetical protein
MYQKLILKKQKLILKNTTRGNGSVATYCGKGGTLQAKVMKIRKMKLD